MTFGRHKPGFCMVSNLTWMSMPSVKFLSVKLLVAENREVKSFGVDANMGANLP